jgi:mannose-6-phosphate isomerase
MGAHPKAPSAVVNEEGEHSLLDLIEQQPAAILGEESVKRFGPTFPFLLKVLASEKALALQVHPDKQQAKYGYEKETERGIPFNAPERNYLDTNHKPEMLCALGPFDCLAGFRSVRQIAEELKKLHPRTIGEYVAAFTESQNAGGLRRLFESIMLMGNERKRMFLEEVVGKAAIAGADRYKWIVELNRQYPRDIGVVSPLFLNLLHLQTGQAVYVEPGIVHAYLGGFGIELMANSDNVVRAGLSNRHVDIPEFIRILRYNEIHVESMDPREIAEGKEVYQTSSRDFRLYRVRLSADLRYVSSGNRAVEIMICIDGRAVIRYGTDGDYVHANRGDSFLIPAEVSRYVLEGEGTFFIAGVP